MTAEIIKQITEHLKANDEEKAVIQLLSPHINTISPTQLMVWLNTTIEKSYSKTRHLILQRLISQIATIDPTLIYPFVESDDYTASQIGMVLLGAKKAYNTLLGYINTPTIRAKDIAIRILLQNTPHLVTINIIETNLNGLSPTELALWLKHVYQNRVQISDTHLSKTLSHFSVQAEGETYLELLAETIEIISSTINDQEVMHLFYGTDAMLKEVSSWILATRFENSESENLIPEIKNTLNDKSLQSYAQTALQSIKG